MARYDRDLIAQRLPRPTPVRCDASLGTKRVEQSSEGLPFEELWCNPRQITSAAAAADSRNDLLRGKSWTNCLPRDVQKKMCWLLFLQQTREINSYQQAALPLLARQQQMSIAIIPAVMFVFVVWVFLHSSWMRAFYLHSLSQAQFVYIRQSAGIWLWLLSNVFWRSVSSNECINSILETKLSKVSWA